MKLFTRITVIFLAFIALVHLCRLFTGWEVIVTGFPIPVWWSVFGIVIPGGLAFMVWRENRPGAGQLQERR